MFKAVIFDMNGVIVNDERIHQQSWRQFSQDHQLHISEEDFKQKVFGRTEKETFQFLFNSTLTEEEISKYSDERVDVAMGLFRPQLRAIQGVVEVLYYLKELQIPMALATSSRKRYQTFIFDNLNLWQYFDAIVTAEDVTKGKPEPEVYLRAAELLSVDPKECVAIEDSVSGIRSAQAAGMKVIGIATTHEAAEIQKADKVVKDFTAQSPAELFQLK